MTALAAITLVLFGASITALVARHAYRAGHVAATGRVVGGLRVLQDQLERHNAATEAALIAATAAQLEPVSEN